MSTMKKLSLSGFKSTFKRKTVRGSGRNNAANEIENSAQQATTVHHGYVCDNESSKTNGIYSDTSASVKDKFRPNSDELIIQNGNGECMTTLESKTSLLVIRKHSNGTKFCDQTNGNFVNNIDNDNGSVDMASIEPGSAANGMNAEVSVKPRKDHQAKSPSNSCVLANGRESTKNVNESIYVGPSPRSSTQSLPPQIGNSHLFQGVSSERHNYINDGVATNTILRTADSSFSELEDENESHKSQHPKLGRQQHHYSYPCGSGLANINSVSDIGRESQHSDGNVNVIPVPPRPRQPKNDRCDCENGDTRESWNQDHSEATSSEDDSLPPAIPPKPAKFFTSGHWNFNSKSSKSDVEDRKWESVSDDDHEVPPRPPARTKVRIGVDITLPFYRQYLERVENSPQPPPVYEAVKLESNPGSGGLAGELSKLPRQPWYWGPMAQDEAEEKLTDAADGSFLVRDSSDERYLLTLSFKSNGRCLHTRIEHRNGLFSLNDSEGHASVIELIHSAVRESQKGVFGYMNDSTGIQNYPARLTQWVSRFSEVKSLQHLCRFVIRETFPRHHIRKLPLPKKINEYILENQY